MSLVMGGTERGLDNRVRTQVIDQLWSDTQEGSVSSQYNNMACTSGGGWKETV